MASGVRPFTLALLSLVLAGLAPSLFSQVVYVANTVSNDVSAYSVDPVSGALTAIPGSPFPAWPVPVAGLYAASSAGPGGAAVDPSGKFLYVSNPRSDTENVYILAFTVNAATGALTAIPGSPFVVGRFLQLGAIAVDPNGKFLYVTDGNIFTLNINAGSGALTGAAPTSNDPTYVATALVVSPTGKFVYSTGCLFFCGAAGFVAAYTPNATSGALTPLPGSPFPAGLGPSGVTVDPTGKFLYVPNSAQCQPICAAGNRESSSPSRGPVLAPPYSPVFNSTAMDT
jgi:6-phosphogluconolactonase